jgi:hypothetical protein
MNTKINKHQNDPNFLKYNFVQLLAQDLVMTRDTTYPKLGCRGVIFFELWQI